MIQILTSYAFDTFNRLNDQYNQECNDKRFKSAEREREREREKRRTFSEANI